MSDNPDSMIGYDPLAWLTEDSDGPSGDGADETAPHAAPDDEPVSAARPEAEPDVAKGDSAVITLPETLHVSEVQSLYVTMQSALAAERPLELDGGAVERADGASLQLLAAFTREAGAGGRVVIWRARSDALVRSAACLGLESLIWP